MRELFLHYDRNNCNFWIKLENKLEISLP
jgi:hypothetical protein